MSDKICLITGATDGVGKHTAIALAKKGIIVVLVARNSLKAQLLIEEIIASDPKARVDYIIADLTSLRQVHNLTETFRQRYDHLDILINNAGIFAEKRIVTWDGFESTFQVNYLSQFLLVELLLQHLKKSAQARIINLSSSVYNMGKFDPDNLQSEKKFSTISTYADTKLYVLMYTMELAARLKGSNITANAVHPGIVKTNMMLSATGLFKVISVLAMPFAITPSKGAATSVYLATSDAVKNISGAYFSDSKVVSTKNKYNTPENRKKLWDISAKLLR